MQDFGPKRLTPAKIFFEGIKSGMFVQNATVTSEGLIGNRRFKWKGGSRRAIKLNYGTLTGPWFTPKERSNSNASTSGITICRYPDSGHWGVIGKSNYAGLRVREPVYRTIRELLISYFEHYYNPQGEKSPRRYSQPLNLSRFDRRDWMTAEEDLWWLNDYLFRLPHRSILTPSMVRYLSKMDQRLYEAGRGRDGARISQFSRHSSSRRFPHGLDELVDQWSDRTNPASRGRRANPVKVELMPPASTVPTTGLPLTPIAGMKLPVARSSWNSSI
jgi:hypothetical protein